MCLIQSPRWVVVMPPLLGALLSGNCPLFDWVEVVLASGALVSTSCPCLVDPALAGLLQLLLLLLGAAMSAAVVAVVAQGYPIDRSVPLLGPWVGPNEDANWAGAGCGAFGSGGSHCGNGLPFSV
jgi:hypothetical protein